MALPDELPGRHRDPSDAAEAGRALAAIRQLPEAYREPLTLRLDADGPSAEALSAVLDAAGAEDGLSLLEVLHRVEDDARASWTGSRRSPLARSASRAWTFSG